MTICEVRQAADRPAVESWQRREPALPAVAVLGIGPAAETLAEAAQGLIAEGAALRLVADPDYPDYLVVLGEEAALPWVDGARYLGWDGGALTLTTHQVLPAADSWREAALVAAGADPASLVIVLPEQVLIAAAESAAAQDDAALPAPSPAAAPVS